MPLPNSEFEITTAQFAEAFGRIEMTSKRDSPTLAKEAFRGVLRNLVEITPPGHAFALEAGENVVVVRGAAKRYGEALVRSDIRSIYGAPRDAYDAITAKDGGETKVAKAYWKAYKANDFEQASRLAREKTGIGLYRFDDGEVHRRLRKYRTRKYTSKRHVFFTHDPASLDVYIRKIQGRVGWLAAGWREGAITLGLKLPEWIARHASAPGRFKISISSDTIHLVATNEVKYAREIKDFQRRIAYAFGQQRAAMERRFNHYLANQLRSVGLQVTGVLN